MEHASKTKGSQTQIASGVAGLKPAMMIDHARLGELSQLMNASPAVQRLHAASDSIQRKEPEQEELLQAKSTVPVKANRTGLPDNLKSGIESLSGLSMDHVQVHRNSSRPAQLNAHAFAQGSDIHLAPGQDQHLPHEAWHVVQQAQGRVKPTMQMKGGVAVNDDAGLEREADVMGARALQMDGNARLDGPAPAGLTAGVATAQCKWLQSFEGILRWDVLLGGMQWYFNEATEQFFYTIIDESAVPPDWFKIVRDNEGRPLSEEAFDELGFETLESAPEELIPERGRDTLREKTKAEDRTRIGFEIENSWHFTTAVFEGYDSVVNKTLLTYIDKNGPLLELLLDDARLIRGGKEIDFQAEFRTTPLDIESIGLEVSKRVKTAITTLKPKDIFTEKSLPAGWHGSELYNDLRSKKFHTADFRFTMPKEMAQHVTSSINVESYTRLSPSEQKILFEKGAGSRNKVHLYRNILSAMAEAEIDATTTGRNSAGAMVKTPIEAMLAGEDSNNIDRSSEFLKTFEGERHSNTVKVSEKMEDKHPIGDIVETARAIVEGGEYPSIQGEHGRGYLARAEKLQPPLLDPRNRQLRVLVEHRTDELRRAFNFILSGRSPRSEQDMRSADLWKGFVKATGRMDDLAREK